MDLIRGNDEIIEEYEKHISGTAKPLHYRLTPFIVTFCEGELTSIDIKTFLEMGLKIIRFKMTRVTKSAKIAMLDMIKDAVKWCCDKYEVTTWPITISVDVPNACIQTGFLKYDTITEIDILEDWTVEITSDTKYWNKCDSKRIFINDQYIIKSIKPGTEIAIHFGMIVLICTEIIDNKTIRCRVLRGDKLRDLEFVCVRGVKHSKPPLSKIDLELIAFAKKFKLDVITINSVRWAATLQKVRDMFIGEERVPLIMSSICEQEGLDNIDEIIEISDAIILAREFLANEIMDKHKMVSIQLQVGAKCKKYGKPFYISGNILERTLYRGTITGCDVTDITNAVQQGAGFVMRSYKDPLNVLKAMKILDEISKMVESTTMTKHIWRMANEFKMPVNAAEACVLASALLAQQTNSPAFIVPTVTGKTAIQLTHIAPEAVIFSISTNPVIASQLQVYRGIVAIVYDKPPLNCWYEEMAARVKFAVAYGLKHDILLYGQNYVELRRGSPISAYCDTVSVFKVTIDKPVNQKYQCTV